VPLGKTLSNNVIHESIALLKGVAGLLTTKANSQGRLILQNSADNQVNLIIAKGILGARGSKELRRG
jgi:hypothetical protein